MPGVLDSESCLIMSVIPCIHEYRSHCYSFGSQYVVLVILQTVGDGERYCASGLLGRGSCALEFEIGHHPRFSGGRRQVGMCRVVSRGRLGVG